MTHSPPQLKPDASLRPESTTMPQRITRRQFVLRNLAAFATAAYVEGANEAEQIEVTRHRLVLKNLREPMRVVQITDLHRSWCVSESFISRVITQANAQKPDLILLTGDFVTGSSGYAASCMQQIARLRAPLGMYAVLGNHDYWCDQHKGGPVITEALHSVGVEVVINRSTKLDNGLRLIGLDDSRAGTPDVSAGFARVEPNEPILAMTHNPGLFYQLRHRDCVTLAGHTHGGQINIPILSDHLMGGPFTRGWYKFPTAPGSLYVSRGLGTIHIPIRLRSVPEIAVFDAEPY